MNATTTILWAFLALQGGAKPQEPAPARAAYEQARREYQLGHYGQAADAFAELYRSQGDPVMLFNAAQSLRLAGRGPEAIAAYKGYLRDRPEAQNRAMVEYKIRELEAPQGPRAKRREPSEMDLVDPMEPSPRPPITTPTPRTVPAAALPMASSRPSPAPAPVWKKWWVWTAVGGALVAGTVVAVAATSRGSDVPGTPLGNQGIFR